MLIQSERHTQQDLRLWNEYERADKVHAMTLGSKITKSLKCIMEFADERCYAGISWGKDSMVLAHLVAICGHSIPLVWFRIEPIKNPECEAVRDSFLSNWRCEYHEIERWCRRDKAGWHASGTLESAAKECASRFGSRKILGIRADESAERRLTCMVNGESSANSCRPLAWWSDQDVMAYLAEYELPVHPAYAMLGGGRYERKWIRVASLGGERGRGMDRAAWEQEYYSDVLNRIVVMKVR